MRASLALLTLLKGALALPVQPHRLNEEALQQITAEKFLHHAHEKAQLSPRAWTLADLANWFGGHWDYSYGDDPAKDGYVAGVPAGVAMADGPGWKRDVSSGTEMPEEVASRASTLAKRTFDDPDGGYYFYDHDYYHHPAKDRDDLVINGGYSGNLLDRITEYMALYNATRTVQVPDPEEPWNDPLTMGDPTQW